jgi:sugar phosphate permease
MNRIDDKRTRFAPVIVIVAGLIVLAVTLFRVPLATVFTVGLLLVCPLLMVGMHAAGHGGEHAWHADEIGADRGDRAKAMSRRERP